MDVLPIVIGGVVFIILASLVGSVALYKRVQPNQIMVIYGKGGATPVSGGGKFVIPVLQAYKTIDCGLRTLDIPLPNVPTKDFVPVNVDAIMQYKVSTKPEAVDNAASNFLQKSVAEIDEATKHILTGKLREIVVSLLAKDLMQDQEQVMRQVTDKAKPDLEKLGLELLQFTITRIYDDHEYYDNLGAEEIAGVQRQAAIAMALAEQETREKKAAAKLAGNKAEIDATAAESEFARERDVKVADNKTIADTAKAKAEMAMPLQTAALQLDLARNQGAAEIERQKQAGLARQEAIAVAEREQEATVVVPAKARKQQLIEEAEGEAEARKKRAEAEAKATEVTGDAEGKKLRSIGEGQAAAQQANLLAEATGKERLAEANAGQDEINLRQFEIQTRYDTMARIGQAMAGAMGQIGGKAGVKIVQFAGGSNGNGNGRSGNALFDLMDRTVDAVTMLNAKVGALTGRDASQWVDAAGHSLRGQPNGLSSLQAPDGEDSDEAQAVEAQAAPVADAPGPSQVEEVEATAETPEAASTETEPVAS